MRLRPVATDRVTVTAVALESPESLCRMMTLNPSQCARRRAAPEYPSFFVFPCFVTSPATTILNNFKNHLSLHQSQSWANGVLGSVTAAATQAGSRRRCTHRLTDAVVLMNLTGLLEQVDAAPFVWLTGALAWPSARAWSSFRMRSVRSEGTVSGLHARGFLACLFVHRRLFV